MKKILIIPDVHGRDFWIEPVKRALENDDYFIVFLGDYLSCYPDEWPQGVDYNKIAIDRFKEIVKIKKENPDKVVLLLGNHDCSYFNTEICECRTDYINWNWLHNFYMDNIKLFDLCWETRIVDKRYFFSHSGVRKDWFDKWVKDNWFKWDSSELPPDWLFNNMLHAAYDKYNQTAADKLEMALGVYSYFRGRTSSKNGSIVWADIREYAKGETLETDYNDVVFVCGHTQLEDKPIIRDWVMDLDCRKPFVLDTETGKVEEFK